ncbi:MAG: Hint domain-containing protein [Azoarcus sp.]|jgi:hypothetical protein|nr:Hint domain-containing protein [Azoarcus sp.]
MSHLLHSLARTTPKTRSLHDRVAPVNAKGEMVYKVCLAPGALVYTDQGLVPIENIRVGMKALSQPEDGELAMNPDWLELDEPYLTLVYNFE